MEALATDQVPNRSTKPDAVLSKPLPAELPSNWIGVVAESAALMSVPLPSMEALVPPPIARQVRSISRVNGRLEALVASVGDAVPVKIATEPSSTVKVNVPGAEAAVEIVPAARMRSFDPMFRKFDGRLNRASWLAPVPSREVAVVVLLSAGPDVFSVASV